jgi:hypothetical protein
MPTGLDLLA